MLVIAMALVCVWRVNNIYHSENGQHPPPPPRRLKLSRLTQPLPACCALCSTDSAHGQRFNI